MGAGGQKPAALQGKLFTRRDGAYREYMPMKIGFGKTELIDGRLTRFDKELKLVKADYNAAADRKTTLADLKALKAKGNNTIAPTTRSRHGSTTCATSWGFTSSTAPISTRPKSATTAG